MKEEHELQGKTNFKKSGSMKAPTLQLNLPQKLKDPEST